MKRIIAMLLALTMLFALAACAAQEPADAAQESGNQGETKPVEAESAPSEAPAEGDKEPVTLKFLHWQTEISEQLQDVIDSFQEAYPWITVEQEIVPTSDWVSVTAARIAGNDTLDIMGVQPWCDAAAQTPAFYENGFLMSLEDLDCVANFSPSTLNSEVRSDGVLTSLPLSSQTMVVYYNVDLFNEYGVEVPTTWSEFLAACETFKQAGIAPIALGAKDGWPVSNMTCQLYESIIEPVYGTDVFQKIWNGEATYGEVGFDTMLQCYADITDNGYWYENPLATAYSDAPVVFATGKCAMYEDGSWSALQIEDCEPDFEVGVFALNGSDDPSVNNLCQKYGLTVGIASRTAYPEECKLFVEYMFRSDIYEALANACSYMPTELGAQATDPLTAKIKELVDSRDAVPFYASYKATVVADGFTWDLDTALQAIISGEQSAEEALAYLQQSTDTARAAKAS